MPTSTFFTKIRIYGYIDSVAFKEDGASEPFLLLHKSLVKISKSGSAGLQFEHATTSTDIAIVENFADVLDETGAVYGGSLDAVMSALANELNMSIIAGTVAVSNIPALGQALMANSLPVAIASNQSAIPVTGTFSVGASPYGDFGKDAGGRTRVAQITTLLDGKILGEDDIFLFENIGTGTAAYSNNKVNLSVTAGQYMIRQSKRFCPYFSGKVQLIEFTCDNFQTEANVTKRYGYFSSSAVAPYDTNFDGFFIEDNGVKKTFYAYRNGTKTIEVDLTAMTNYAAVNSYNYENFTVFAVDFLWLGGAVVRFWLKTDLGFVLLHTVNYSGSQKDVFILSPNQPLRMEIRSTGGAGSFRYICSQVATEGSIDEAGKTVAVINYTSVTTNVVGTIYALKGIKKRAAFRDVPFQILQIAVAITASTDAGVIMMYKNPTLSAPLAYTPNGKIDDGSPTNPAAAPTITAGTGRLIASLPIGNGTTGSSEVMKENFLSFLSSTINNTMDEYVLAYMPTTNNQTVNGVINLKEF